MIKFVLLFFVFYGSGSSPMTAEYDSLDSCKTAANSFSEKLATEAAIRIVWDCSPK